MACLRQSTSQRVCALVCLDEYMHGHVPQDDVRSSVLPVRWCLEESVRAQEDHMPPSIDAQVLLWYFELVVRTHAQHTCVMLGSFCRSMGKPGPAGPRGGPMGGTPRGPMGGYMPGGPMGPPSRGPMGLSMGMGGPRPRLCV